MSRSFMYVYGNTFNDQVEADIFGEIKRRKDGLRG